MNKKIKKNFLVKISSSFNLDTRTPKSLRT